MSNAPSLRRGARVLALAASLAVAGVQAQDAKDSSLRTEVAKPLQAAQELIKAGKAADALAKVREAEAVANRTAFEVFTIERMKGSAAMAAGDSATALKAFTAVVEAGRLPPADQLAVLQAMAAMAVRAGDHATAVTSARRYFKEGGEASSVRVALVQALFAQGDLPGTQRELLPLILADEAAGKAPSEEQLKLLGHCQIKQNDEAGYAQTLERLVTHHPKAGYWADLLTRLQRKPGFADRLLLDVFRLMRQTGTLEDAAEYMDMAQLALLAGLPGEAREVVEEGYGKAVLGKGTGSERHQRMRDNARKLAADDQAQLAASETQALAAKDGGQLVALGQAVQGYGQADKGLALMAQGLAKGVQRHPDDARLHVGVSLLRAGQRDKALEMLRSLQAADGSADLARLWPLAQR